MNGEYGIVILNRYPELAEKFIQSIRTTHKELPNIVVVRDRNDATHGDDVAGIDGKVPIVFARNVNAGLQYWGDKDVIVCNDDMECVENDFFPRFYVISNFYSNCGMLSPLIKGGVGNRMQSYARADWKTNEITSKESLCFPCILIKRKLIDKIGLLDENFTGYGLEDMDYCLRAYQSGLDLMITKQLYIIHGDGTDNLSYGHNFSCSYAREPRKEMPWEYFKSKHANRVR